MVLVSNCSSCRAWCQCQYVSLPSPSSVLTFKKLSCNDNYYHLDLLRTYGAQHLNYTQDIDYGRYKTRWTERKSQSR
ncbi:hypothetical protein THOE12_20465 [Vibrio rotiferianus]|nr:hypothetical protein THOE12_20465 [Vibrio rotiferianus]